MRKTNYARYCRNSRASKALLTVALLGTLLLAVGCSEAANEGESEAKKGFGMGGVEQQIKLRAATVNDRPAAWNLDTPESAVRSYIDWVSYAYRIAESEAATPTQSPHQVVRTDAYVQANLQKEQILDQVLDSISFGEVSVEETRATVSAEENWSYRYISIDDPDKIVAGPSKVSYKNTYTLVKTDSGWVVDDIEVERLGSGK